MLFSAFECETALAILFSYVCSRFIAVVVSSCCLFVNARSSFTSWSFDKFMSRLVGWSVDWSAFLWAIPCYILAFVKVFYYIALHGQTISPWFFSHAVNPFVGTRWRWVATFVCKRFKRPCSAKIISINNVTWILNLKMFVSGVNYVQSFFESLF